MEKHFVPLKDDTKAPLTGSAVVRTAECVCIRSSEASPSEPASLRGPCQATPVAIAHCCQLGALPLPSSWFLPPPSEYAAQYHCKGTSAGRRLSPEAMACPSLILQASLLPLASISNEFRIKTSWHFSPGPGYLLPKSLCPSETALSWKGASRS